jgi:FtsP/CotA-like multicopper oxidase with cupredoxin domain
VQLEKGLYGALVVRGSDEPELDGDRVLVLDAVRIAWLPDDRPGSWMYHCHILEHHAAGMMAHFDVIR